MLEKFNSFKKKITFYSILYWVVSWVFVSIIINGFGVLVLGVEFGNTDSTITNLFVFPSLIVCIYLATRLTNKFRSKKYSNWLIANLDEKDPDLKSVMNKLMTMNVLDVSIVNDSNLGEQSKSFIVDFESNDNNRVTALKEKYKIKINEEGLYVLPYIYTLGYMVISLIMTILIARLPFTLISPQEEPSNLTIIIFLILVGLLIYMFIKLSPQFAKMFKNKAILIIDKKGITYKNTFYEWENIELSNEFISEFENLDPRNNKLDLKFKYKKNSVNLNFNSTKILDI
ncbi:MAG: hypothetical protein KC414_09135, partial [Romboutsia sp.]|nr:hypothetical protein [Romboutsia sp.]